MALRYREFEKLILDFQLKNHHRFLSRFISLFRSYDQNNFGFIDAPQFRDMVGSIDPENRLDSERLLQQIDPQEMGVIPFSACAAVFASEPMPSDAEGPTTILHYISAESS